MTSAMLHLVKHDISLYRKELQRPETLHSCIQGKLGLDRGVRLENLMVSHFLSAMDRLADPALLQFVKHLQSRAQGEVSCQGRRARRHPRRSRRFSLFRTKITSCQTTPEHQRLDAKEFTFGSTFVRLPFPVYVRYCDSRGLSERFPLCGLGFTEVYSVGKGVISPTLVSARHECHIRYLISQSTIGYHTRSSAGACSVVPNG